MAEEDVELKAILASLSKSRRDMDAWEHLYLKIWPLVFGVIFRFLHGRRELSEDVAQQVFVRLILYCPFDELQEPAVFRAYVTLTAKNTARDAVKRLLKNMEFPIELARQQEEWEKILAREDSQDLAVADSLKWLLLGCDPVDSRIFKLHLDGESLSAIAKATGFNYSAVAVRLHRLKRRLREKLSHSPPASR